MGYRTLEINHTSAKGLKQVNLFTKMDVYAVVSIVGNNTKDEQKTSVDSEGDTNPTWNVPMKFSVDESAAQLNRLTLVITLRCQRALGDKDVGEVNVPIKELLNSAGEGKSMQFVRYQVRKPSGKPKGELNFSYKFDQKDVGTRKVGKQAPEKVDDNIVTASPKPTPTVVTSSMYPSLYEVIGAGAYPALGGGYPALGGGYPPPAPMVGYGYPPPQYEGYPQLAPPPQYSGYSQPHYGYQLQPGYGYPPVQQPQKKNEFGLGLGAGLLGGALGGLLIGDMVSNVGSYDGGFCDGGF